MTINDNGVDRQATPEEEAKYLAELKRFNSPKRQIRRKKEELTDTDYKIIKCNEYQMAGLPLPYDINELHKERQALRDKINQLEQEDANNV